VDKFFKKIFLKVFLIFIFYCVTKKLATCVESFFNLKNLIFILYNPQTKKFHLIYSSGIFFVCGLYTQKVGGG